MILNLLSFPGVLFHELAHLLMCVILGIKVRKFNASLSLSGFVVHDVPGSITKSILIATAPMLLALLFSYLLLDLNNIIKYYLMFIVLYHSFPSKEDTNFGTHHSISKRILTFPIFAILRVIYHIGSGSTLRIAYSVAVIVFLDNVI